MRLLLLATGLANRRAKAMRQASQFLIPATLATAATNTPYIDHPIKAAPSRYNYFTYMRYILICLLFGINGLFGQIVPPNWVSAKLLEQAETEVQKQLDSGQAMNSAVEDMAAVRDARLLVIYLELFQSLDKNSQTKLYQEQTLWLQNRGRELKKLRVSGFGSDVSLSVAQKQLDLTNERIIKLSERLKQTSENRVDH